MTSLPLGPLLLFGAAAAAYCIVANATLIGLADPAIGLVLGLGWILVALVTMAWRGPWRWPVVLACLAAAIGIFLSRSWWIENLPWVWLVQHAGSYALLAIVFGRTLRAGSEPIATRVVRIVLKSVPAEVSRYTRGVTLAWTVLFAAIAGVSVMLFFASSTAVWSAFANLVSGPMVAAMFVGEYLVRCRVVPKRYRATLGETIAAFRALSTVPAGPQRPAATAVPRAGLE